MGTDILSSVRRAIHVQELADPQQDSNLRENPLRIVSGEEYYTAYQGRKGLVG